jgi:hypothetical protein
MTPDLGIVIVGMLLFLVPLLLACFLAFDRVVRRQYASHRSAWESDGRPRGFFWRPAEATVVRSYFAQQRLSLTWLFSTPHWARQDPSASRSLKSLRRLVLAWNVSMVVAAAVVWFWGVPQK